MRAIDTNVAVRFLVRDDEAQAQRALAVIGAGDVFIANTVVLETEWVIRRLYGLSPPQTAAGLRSLAGVAGVTLEDPELVAQALAWMEGGIDFADALHLGRAQGCSAFLSFDRKLAKVARGRTSLAIEEP